MRILFVGKTGRGQTSGMRANAFRRLGHEIQTVDSSQMWTGVSYVERLFIEKVEKGRAVDQLNESVLKAARQFQPHLVWAEKQEYIRPGTVEAIQREGALVAYYNPDPYFTVKWKRRRLTDAALRLCDLVVATKEYELNAYRKHVTGHVVYSPLGFDPVVHRPPATSGPDQKYTCEIGFVGGWAPRREQMLATLANQGLSTKIWGYGWSIAQSGRFHPLRALRLGRLDPDALFYLKPPARSLRSAIQPGESGNGEIYEERYARAVYNATVNLGFLRKAWPDQHTTRSFEIPAMSGFMLADRTDEHLALFEEGKEAEFFSSEEECVDKANFYAKQPEVARRIGRAGRDRCLSSGYSYDERLQAVLSQPEVQEMTQSIMTSPSQ